MTIPDKVTNHSDRYIGLMRMSKPEFHQNIVEEYALSRFKGHFLCLGWSTKASSYNTPHQKYTPTKTSFILDRRKSTQTIESCNDENKTETSCNNDKKDRLTTPK